MTAFHRPIDLLRRPADGRTCIDACALPSDNGCGLVMSQRFDEAWRTGRARQGLAAARWQRCCRASWQLRLRRIGWEGGAVTGAARPAAVQ